MASTPGVYYDSLAGTDSPVSAAGEAAGNTGICTAKVPIFLYAGTTSYNVFPVSVGAPCTSAVVGFGGIMGVAGAGGMTIQLQTSAGVAITNAISLAALAQYGTFLASSINYANGTANLEGNFLVVTVGSVVGVCYVEVMRVNA